MSETDLQTVQTGNASERYHYTIEVRKKDGEYVASEPHADTERVGRGKTPPLAIREYVEVFVDDD